MGITVNQLSKRFGQFQALDNINLTVKPGTLVALLGPSGSGKSTLLRTIAGLESPDHGSILIKNRDATRLDVRKRNIGFVFQHYALFKHLTVRQNILFGLEIRRCNAKKAQAKVEELLDLIQLQGLGNRYPGQLSGGQRQRVALARSLAVEPEILLLDEPFGALDAKVRKELRNWLRQLHHEIRLTSVFVTHDQEEAMEVADEVVIMNQGRIEQVGTPAEIYDNPATPFVMSFIGDVNVLPGTAHLFQHHNLSSNQTKGFVRPHDLEICTLPDENTAQATIKRILHLGRDIQVELNLPDSGNVTAHLNREQLAHLELHQNQQVYLKSRQTKFFEEPASLLSNSRF